MAVVKKPAGETAGQGGTCVLVEDWNAELLCLEAEEPAMMGEIAAIEAEEDDLDSLTQEAMLRILKDKLKNMGELIRRLQRNSPNLMIITDLNEMLDESCSAAMGLYHPPDRAGTVLCQPGMG